jgi:hypothetical protein
MESMSTKKMLELVHPELTACTAISRTGDPCELQLGHMYEGEYHQRAHSATDNNGDQYTWRYPS